MGRKYVLSDFSDNQNKAQLRNFNCFDLGVKLICEANSFALHRRGATLVHTCVVVKYLRDNTFRTRFRAQKTAAREREGRVD